MGNCCEGFFQNLRTSKETIKYAYILDFAIGEGDLSHTTTRQFMDNRLGHCIQKYVGASFERPDVTQPSFENITCTGMLKVLSTMHSQAISKAGGPVRWRFVTWGMGGYLAARWAQQNPEKVDRLVLISPAFDIPSAMEASMRPEGSKLADWKAERMETLFLPKNSLSGVPLLEKQGGNSYLVTLKNLDVQSLTEVQRENLKKGAEYRYKKHYYLTTPTRIPWESTVTAVEEDDEFIGVELKFSKTWKWTNPYGEGIDEANVHFRLIEDYQDSHSSDPVVPCPTLIIHGTNDEIVPLSVVTKYAEAQKKLVEIVSLDGDHGMGADTKVDVLRYEKNTRVILPTIAKFFGYERLQVVGGETLSVEREETKGQISGTYVKVGEYNQKPLYKRMDGEAWLFWWTYSETRRGWSFSKEDPAFSEDYFGGFQIDGCGIDNDVATPDLGNWASQKITITRKQ